MDPIAFTIFFLVSLTLLGYWLRRVGRRESHLPPGPPTKAIIGNIHLVPKSFLHLQSVKFSPPQLTTCTVEIIIHPPLDLRHGRESMGPSFR